MTKFESLKMELINVAINNIEALDRSPYRENPEVYVNNITESFDELIAILKQFVENEEMFQAYKNELAKTDDYVRLFKGDSQDTLEVRLVLESAWVLAKYLFPVSLRNRGINPEDVKCDNLNDMIKFYIDEANYELAKTDDELKAYLACIIAEGDLNYTKIKSGMM